MYVICMHNAQKSNQTAVFTIDDDVVNSIERVQIRLVQIVYRFKIILKTEYKVNLLFFSLLTTTKKSQTIFVCFWHGADIIILLLDMTQRPNRIMPNEKDEKKKLSGSKSTESNAQWNICLFLSLFWPIRYWHFWLRHFFFFVLHFWINLRCHIIGFICFNDSKTITITKQIGWLCTQIRQMDDARHSSSNQIIWQIVEILSSFF